jgi:hypothetical protein
MTPHQTWYPKRLSSPWVEFRQCHAKAARKHRRQGHDVRFSHWSPTRRTVYMWRVSPWRSIVSEWAASRLHLDGDAQMSERQAYQDEMIQHLSGRLSNLPPRVLIITTPKGTTTIPWGERP